jgi:hypothetical protein
MYEKQGHPGNSKQILTRALELASNNPYWSNRLLFQVPDQQHQSLAKSNSSLFARFGLKVI